MHECRCPEDNKKLAEIARPTLKEMEADQLCTCGRWMTPSITLDAGRIIRNVCCICGYHNTGVVGYLVRITCINCKKTTDF